MRRTFLAALAMLAVSMFGPTRADGQAATDSGRSQQGLMTFRVAPVDGGVLPADYVRRITQPLGALLAAVDEYHTWERDVYLVVHRDGSVRFDDFAQQGDTVGPRIEREIEKAAALGIFAPLPAPFTDSLAIGLGITHPAAMRPAAGNGGVYFEFQVEKTVLPRVQVKPEYPAALRGSGVEGRVLVKFVVNAEGFAEMNTFRVLESPNVALSEAVRRAVEKSRYFPASIGEKTVRQVVMQPFTFELPNAWEVTPRAP